MRRFWGNRLFRLGAILFLVGSGPLLFIIVAPTLGLWPDPDPNPIGPGLLAMFTFWPAVVLLILGAVQVSRGNRPAGRHDEEPSPDG